MTRGLKSKNISRTTGWSQPSHTNIGKEEVISFKTADSGGPSHTSGLIMTNTECDEAKPLALSSTGPLASQVFWAKPLVSGLNFFIYKTSCVRSDGFT